MLLPGGAIGPGFKMLHEEGRTGRAWKKEMALGQMNRLEDRATNGKAGAWPGFMGMGTATALRCVP